MNRGNTPRNCSGPTRRWQVLTAPLRCGPITLTHIIIGPIRCMCSSASTKRWRASTAPWRYGRALRRRVNRGVTLHALARFEEALATCDAAAALAAGFREAAFANRGMTLHALKRFDEALTSFDRALVLRPDNAEALGSRGVTLHVLQRFDEALASYDRALELQPDNAEVALQPRQRLSCAQALRRGTGERRAGTRAAPDYPGRAFANRRHHPERAETVRRGIGKSCDRALRCDPDYAEAHTNRGVTLHTLKRFDERAAVPERAALRRGTGFRPGSTTTKRCAAC